MKIEKLNDNQIRCTLTRDDLTSRNLKLSELAYGTEKAKSLFRDMMRQANFEFGFEAEDIPLMIEAIPLNADSIVLLITKVEDPEELDTRFARFAPSVTEGTLPVDEEEESVLPEEASDLFRRIQEVPAKPAADKPNPKKDFPSFLVFAMKSLQDIITVSELIVDRYEGNSMVYKDDKGIYYLALHKGATALPDFRKICNTVSEYGALCKNVAAIKNFLAERCETLIADGAVHRICGQ